MNKKKERSKCENCVYWNQKKRKCQKECSIDEDGKCSNFIFDYTRNTCESKKGSIRSMAISHLKSRWAYLEKMGWTGSLSFERYLKVNLNHAIKNIKSGMVPDGRGFYKKVE